MDFRDLSFTNAPLIKVTPPGPRSKDHLDYQSSHESSLVNYPKGMPMAPRRAKGATVEDVALMRKTVGPEMGVKASGGIKDFETAAAMIAAGATRIGAGAGVAIVGGAEERP